MAISDSLTTDVAAIIKTKATSLTETPILVYSKLVGVMSSDHPSINLASAVVYYK